MKSWAFAAIFVSVAAAAACSDSGTGGSGGSGGSNGVSSSTTTGSSSTTTGSSSTTSTNPAMCDDLAVCGDATDPQTCLGCALAGDCADELASCQGDQECIDFVTCIDPCADQACFDACVTMYPNGATLYNDLVFCAICEQCPISCDGPGSGCP